MKKKKPTLSARERAEKKHRNREFMFIFINGKQKRIRRPPTIDGIPVDEFIMNNADPIWLHQNEMWELMPIAPPMSKEDEEASLRAVMGDEHYDPDDEIPF